MVQMLKKNKSSNKESFCEYYEVIKYSPSGSIGFD